MYHCCLLWRNRWWCQHCYPIASRHACVCGTHIHPDDGFVIEIEFDAIDRHVPWVCVIVCCVYDDATELGDTECIDIDVCEMAWCYVQPNKKKTKQRKESKEEKKERKEKKKKECYQPAQK